MASKIILTEKDLLGGIMVDTRIDLIVTDITDEQAVQDRVHELYGAAAVNCEQGLIAYGSAEPFKKRYSFGDLMGILGVLTSESGCPWDKVQTHESIRSNMVEEAYELVAAIDNNDLPNIIEECGDVLLQAVFHANIAERSGTFNLDDVVHNLCYKLVSRHTHIFGDDKAADAGEALKVWEKAKSREHADDLTEKLHKLEKSMPTLLYAQKAIKTLRRAGLIVEDGTESADNLLPMIIKLCNSGVDLETYLRAKVREFSKECIVSKGE